MDLNICDFCGCITDGKSECSICFANRFITHTRPRKTEIFERMADQEHLTRLAIFAEERKKHELQAV
jgi:hypothetical protein